MKLYIILKVKQNRIISSYTREKTNIGSPKETTMEIFNLVKTCKTDTKSVFISVIVPRSGKLNTKASKVNRILRHECNGRNICFIDNKQISPRFHCNWSGIHMNYYGTKKLREIVLYELAKLDRQFDMVRMYTLSKDTIRVRNKNKSKSKKKTKKKVSSGNRVEQSSYRHIDLNTNSSYESFLSEFSDTLND